MKYENRYTGADRLLHRLAFRTGAAQVALSDLEDRLYRSRLAGIAPAQPLFITALPRAGTTLLLDLCDRSGEFTAHRYSDMPFLMIPMLWQRFSASFRRHDELRERAHGDGMMINTDSPEAFEEMIWKQFWPAHYRADRIIPWGTEDHPEFFDFLRRHICKIIALHQDDTTQPARYVSKNNLNIARIGMLAERFSDAVVVIPFRHPIQHAASLLRQHLNFLDIHRSDPFACEYMAAIGHYDFGDNLRPVDFDGWLVNAGHRDATSLAFWLEYWIACYRHLLDAAGRQPRIHLLSYERFCADPGRNLATFADMIGATAEMPFIEMAPAIRPSRPHDVDTGKIDPMLLDKAISLHQDLLAAAEI